jgi:hypothetical protein
MISYLMATLVVKGATDSTDMRGVFNRLPLKTLVQRLKSKSRCDHSKLNLTYMV